MLLSNAAWTLDVHIVCSSLSCLITDIMVIFFPLHILLRVTELQVWLVLLMHFPPLLPFSFPKPLFVALTVLSLPSQLSLLPVTPLLTFSFLFPCVLALFPQVLPLSFFPLSLPPLLSVTCGYWSLADWWFLIGSGHFPFSAWVHSALVASVSSDPVLILVCETLALHFLPSFQN